MAALSPVLTARILTTVVASAGLYYLLRRAPAQKPTGTHSTTNGIEGDGEYIAHTDARGNFSHCERRRDGAEVDPSFCAFAWELRDALTDEEKEFLGWM